jgi:hypothetical protein
MKEYKTPEVEEYGRVEQITESGGTDKVGDESDEFSGSTPLDGSVGFE